MYEEKIRDQQQYIADVRTGAVSSIILIRLQYKIIDFLITFYTIPWKMQPIRLQESHCMFNSMTSNLPIMHWLDHVATELPMA